MKTILKRNSFFQSELTSKSSVAEKDAIFWKIIIAMIFILLVSFFVSAQTTSFKNDVAVSNFDQETLIFGAASNSVSTISLEKNRMASCQEESPMEPDPHSGYNMALFKTANDITVAAGEQFTLTHITVNISANDGIDQVDVTYYDDEEGFPGSVIGSQSNLIITSQSVVGITSGGRDINVVEMAVDPFVFRGLTSSQATYWIQLKAKNGTNSGNVYWMATRSTMHGNPVAMSLTEWEYPDIAHEGIYTWHGECEVLKVDDHDLPSFEFYPNPTSDLVNVRSEKQIESISLYNIYGHKIMDQRRVGGISSQLSLSSLAAGIYIMKVEVEERTGAYRIIKK